MIKLKLFFVVLFSIVLPGLAVAQSESELTIDQKIDAAFKPVADAVSSVIFYSLHFGNYSVPLVLIILIGGAIFFTLYLTAILIKPGKKAKTEQENMGYHNE